MKNITVYTKINCPNCVIIKNVLTLKKLEYTAIQIDTGSGGDMSIDAFASKFPGVNTMPLITFDDIDGTNVKTFIQMMDILKK